MEQRDNRTEMDKVTLNAIDDGIRLISAEIGFEKGENKVILAEALGKMVSARVCMKIRS